MKRRTYLALFLTLLLGGGVVVFHATTFSNGIARAEEFQSTEQLQFTFNSTISVNITGGDLVIESLTPGDGKDSNIITVTTSSNAAAGYNVYGSVGSDAITSTNLTHANGSNTFTSINTTTTLNNFQDNQWGYAYSTDSGSTWVSGNVGSTAVGYNGLPLYNGADKTAGVLLASTTTPISSSFQFKIGAKAATTQIAGEYTNVINFIGITNPDPEPPVYMQDATLADCGQTMYDKRDNSDYTTALINGQCWMTQNLRFQGTSLSTTTSNVTSDKTLTYYDLDGTEGSSSTGHCYGTSSFAGNGYSNACKHDSGSTTTGVWYNYYAATAGTVSGTSNSTAASQDICPKNWHLPTGPNTTSGTDYNKLVGNTTSGWQNPTAGLTSFGAVAGGRYSNGSLSNTGYGYWWSATANDATYRYSLLYDSSDGQFSGDVSIYRYSGFFVRCVRSS